VHRTRYMRSKRLVDLFLAGLGLVPLALAIPFVWCANLIANRGPLFYRQERVGKGGQPFTMWKFRTMVSSDHSDWTAGDDSRVTPVGRLLRRTHLDELPQVLNILRGELSTVGPRPEQVHYVERLRVGIPFYDVRHLVRPGLTGWAQVKQGYASSDEDTYEKLQYDFFYLRRQGLALDLRIAWRTLRDVAGGGR
jgi:lipopolysaccharide/colanic/teichoic acid biosynthesis glycosyltransferase